MSTLRLTAAILIVGLSSVAAYGQPGSCDNSGSRISHGHLSHGHGHSRGFGGCGFGGYGFGTRGMGGCGGGFGFGCQDSGHCMTAAELWGDFGSNLSCEGCVRRNRLRSFLPGFGGAPAAEVGGCNVHQPLSIPVPSVSVHWPHPNQLGNLQLNTLQPRLRDSLDLLGLGKQKNVRNDIPNDRFGKLGESQAPLATVPVEQPETNVPGPIYDDAEELEIPPAPVVEPLVDLDELPTIENAKNLNSSESSSRR